MVHFASMNKDAKGIKSIIDSALETHLGNKIGADVAAAADDHDAPPGGGGLAE
jgi:hypothetical protein